MFLYHSTLKFRLCPFSDIIAEEVRLSNIIPGVQCCTPTDMGCSDAPHSVIELTDEQQPVCETIIITNPASDKYEKEEKKKRSGIVKVVRSFCMQVSWVSVPQMK